MVFPFVRNGRIVGEKYRGPQKKFWQRKGNYKTFVNAPVLERPELEDPDYPLVITEGEADMASYIEVGHDWTVSVPDGAPQESDKPVPESADDVDPEHDAKYEYVFNNWDRLKSVARIILSCDADGPGWRLAQELARRLGRSRCYYVVYPTAAVVPVCDETGADTGERRPCKDANEVLMHLGPEALNLMLAKARPFPVRGLYTLDEVPDQDVLETVSTGFRALDRDPKNPDKPWLKIYPSLFMPVSGVPAGGKSAIVTQIQFNLAYLHGWKGAVASFEMPTKPVLLDMLRSFYIFHDRVRRGRDLAKWQSHGYERSLTWTKAEIFEADAFIREHFSFIMLAPDDDESEADVEWVIDRAHDALIRHGIRSLNLDPWNEVDHRRRPGESVADYTNRAVRIIKRFAHATDVATFVVCHPDKAAGRKNADGQPLSLYDISDGATWANKAEHGAMVRRLDPNGSLTEFDLKKVKFKGTGKVGPIVLNYLNDCELFDPFLDDQSAAAEMLYGSQSQNDA